MIRLMLLCAFFVALFASAACDFKHKECVKDWQCKEPGWICVLGQCVPWGGDGGMTCPADPLGRHWHQLRAGQCVL